MEIKGVEHDVDTSVYRDAKYDSCQMNQIKLGLMDGLDVSAYADPNFGWEQMRQIRVGLEKKSRCFGIR